MQTESIFVLFWEEDPYLLPHAKYINKQTDKQNINKSVSQTKLRIIRKYTLHSLLDFKQTNNSNYISY